MIVIVTPAAIDRKSDEKKPWSVASPTGSVNPSRRVEHQRRPQEVVPRRDEREDRHGRQRRPDDRQQDRPPDPPLAGAVDAGRVDQLVRHASEGLAQQEDVERAHDVREDQCRQRVVVVEDVHREDEARDVRQLGRDDERREEQVEHELATGEPHLRERIGGHRGHEHVERSRRDRHGRRVEEEARDRQAVPHPDIGGKGRVVGQELRRHRRDQVVRALERRQQHPREREDRDDGHRREHDVPGAVRQPPAAARRAPPRALGVADVGEGRRAHRPSPTPPRSRARTLTIEKPSVMTRSTIAMADA